MIKTIRYLTVGMQNLLKPAKVWAGPLHLQVEVTTFCNLQCVMCSHSTMIKKPQHLSLSDFNKICDKLKPYKISMNGIGEPFLNPDMLAMVKYASQKGIETITTSNLTVIPPQMADEIVASGLNLLKGSIDSTSPETYLAIRQKDMHHKVLEGLFNIHEAKKRANTELPYVRLQFVMQRANFREIPDVFDLCEQFGVGAIYFQPLDLANDNYVTEELVASLIGDMSPDEFREVLRSAAEKSREYSVVTNLAALFQNFDSMWEKYKMTNSPDPESAVCMMPWTSLYIAVDGGIRLCCAFASSPEETLGNIFQNDFDSIWNGEQYQRYRKQFAKGERPNKICRNCLAPTLASVLKSIKNAKYMIK